MSKDFTKLLINTPMATNKVDVRLRLRIFQSVDSALYEFASNASTEELNAAMLCGLRLWMMQAEMRAVGKPLVFFEQPLHQSPAPVPSPVTASPSMGELGLVSLDLGDLGLKGAVVHRAEGG